MEKRFKDFTKKLNELALSDEDYSRFDTYIDEISNDKKTLKNVDNELILLKNKLININYSNICFSNQKYNDNENYEIIFENNIDELIFSVNKLINVIKNKNNKLYKKISNLYFDGHINFSFDVQIDRNNFNKFHFPIELPSFLRNIGLGKKIILKSIQEFDYLLFMDKYDSYDLRFSIDSLIKRIDIFSFMKDKNLMIFKDEFNIIKEKLKEWFDSYPYENYSLDVDFFKKYKDEIIKNSFLNELYKNKNYYNI